MSNESRFEMIMTYIYRHNLQNVFFNEYDRINKSVTNLTHYEISDLVFAELNKQHSFLE